MEIILAKTAGFCFGVARAIRMIEDALAEGRRVCTLGPIIHNTAMVENLCGRGVRIIGSPGEARPNELVVLRSHGVEPDVYEQLRRLGIDFLDGTCPFVSKIHKIVINASSKGDTIILVGDVCHPEVRATLSRCTTQVYCVKTLEEAERLSEEHPELRDAGVTLLAQTTASKEIFDCVKKFIKTVCTNLRIFDTICEATAERQKEAAELAGQVDCMLVIGSAQSSNTRKLLDICREYGPAFLVENAAEIPLEQLAGCSRIGVTAGASAPVFIIKEVQETCAMNCGTRKC